MMCSPEAIWQRQSKLPSSRTKYLKDEEDVPSSIILPVCVSITPAPVSEWLYMIATSKPSQNFLSPTNTTINHAAIITKQPPHTIQSNAQHQTTSTMTDESTQGNMSADNAIPIMTTSFSADTSTSNDSALNPQDAMTASHSALFGLTGQYSPTKFAGSGPGSGIIGTSGVKGKHNSIFSMDAGGLAGKKTAVEIEKSS
jgi:hypothetical protein